MKLENMKDLSFPISSMNDWVDKVEESLKGKKIESLSKFTYENIQVKPLYTKDDTSSKSLSQYPGESDYSRGIDASGYKLKSWYIANKIPFNNVKQLMEKSRVAFSGGQDALAFEVTDDALFDKNSLKNLLKEFSSLGPLSIHPKEFFIPFMETVMEIQNETGKWTGFIASDPIAVAATKGGFNQGEEETFNKWTETIKNADSKLPEVKTVLVDTTPYQNSGANAVQELGIALSTGVYYVQKLLDNGWDLKKALDKILFHFAIGSNFFIETAKLRAARILWDKAMEVYGADEESRKMVISAETSHLTKTIFDPYVNLLRAGNEAFSAVLGGVQYFSVSALDEAAGISSAFSERIARNTQLILKAEAHLERVADPAGGSYYVETLTRELAEKAWQFFLDIEKEGDIVEALKSNDLQKRISEVRAQRDQDVYTRKQSIIGTNVYANLSEQVHLKNACHIEPSSTSFEMIEMKRLAEPYEILRGKALEIASETGSGPTVGLICLGELKNHKVRADFINGFLAAGGIETNRSGELHDSDAVFQFIRTSGLNHFCLCGDNRQYAENGITLVEQIKTEFPNVKLTLAGKLDEELTKGYLKAGILEFYYLNSNNYEILSNLLREMEVARGDEEA